MRGRVDGGRKGGQEVRQTQTYTEGEMVMQGVWNGEERVMGW